MQWGRMQWRKKKAKGSEPSDKGINVFCFPFCKKIGASSSDDGKDGAERMGRGECHPSSRGVGAYRDGGECSGGRGKQQGANKAEEGVDVFRAPSCNNLEPHHQTMATMDPKEFGEVIAAHHLEEEVRIAIGGNARDYGGSGNHR